MKFAEIVSIISIVIAIGGLATQYFLIIMKNREAISRIESRCNPEERARNFNELAQQVKELSVKIQPFWSVLETQVPTLLKMPHTIRKDTLLERMTNKVLTYDEGLELERLLENEKSTVSKEMQLIYGFALSSLKHRLKDGREAWVLE